MANGYEYRMRRCITSIRVVEDSHLQKTLTWSFGLGQRTGVQFLCIDFGQRQAVQIVTLRYKNCKYIIFKGKMIQARSFCCIAEYVLLRILHRQSEQIATPHPAKMIACNIHLILC